ncbi:MAG: IPT/TIG domain-containing protein, partial [Capsulimonas sp.]|uniref:IPT/TIG domain-containing protein n=1 Tax=Capsulimonas sp. TaxID=2494211 RepID=UPI003265A870
MRRRRIQTVFYTIALLWAALASEPLIAQADAVPAISSLSPISVSAGSGGLTLTINGGGFDSSAQVKFNGDVLTPASITATRITAVVPAADVECGGYVGVTITTTSGESTFKLFTIENQAPQIFGLTPTMAFSGGSFFTLTLVGSGFNSQTQVLFGPDKLTPDTASPTQLTVTVPAGEIAFPGTFSISAFNPDPVTGTPNTQTFTVVRPYPIISSISPNTIPAGTPDLSVTITGLNFTNASTVQWNDTSLTTTFVSATSLKAVIPAASLAAMTTANITVSDTDYGVSAPVPFVVTAPIPMASALNPASANSGDPDFTLTINGASFQAGSVVKWGNTALATTFVSS